MQPQLPGGPAFDMTQFLSNRGITRPSDRDPAESAPEDSGGFTSTQQETVSSFEVVSLASQIDGPSVDIDGEGDFSGNGVATVEDVTSEASAGDPMLGGDRFMFVSDPGAQTQFTMTSSGGGVAVAFSLEEDVMMNLLDLQGRFEEAPQTGTSLFDPFEVFATSGVDFPDEFWA
ncbi:hypothetical protein [Pseudooctadecabacter sp.]|uniref:hypothetical protein n=1 Tax=Pseudooctadecabacter sp. TaxID=1966338 RepID=UPI0035C79B39